MEVFSDRSGRILLFDENDRVLDFGCGLGSFAHHFKKKVSAIDGVDINSKYISHCSKKYNTESLNFHKLDESNFTNLDVLGEKTFTKCIINSVVQYFDDQQQLYKLINEIYARRDQEKGITILILDFPTERSSTFKDVLWQLYFGVRYRYVTCVIYSLIRAVFSRYLTIRSNVGLLELDRSNIEEFFTRNDFSYRFSKQILTVNGSREHLLINCP